MIKAYRLELIDTDSDFNDDADTHPQEKRMKKASISRSITTLSKNNSIQPIGTITKVPMTTETEIAQCVSLVLPILFNL
jgi:hypothetical protein